MQSTGPRGPALRGLGRVPVLQEVSRFPHSQDVKVSEKHRGVLVTAGPAWNSQVQSHTSGSSSGQGKPAWMNSSLQLEGEGQAGLGPTAEMGRETRGS